MTRLLIVGACVTLACTEAQAQPPDPVKIGLQSLLNEVPESTVSGVIRSFEDLVKQMTGLNGKAVQDGDAYKLAKDLKEGKVHVGVFQGFELAWTQEKEPKLKPLMIGVYYDPRLRAEVVVQKGYKGDTLAGLKGKELAIPQSSPGHCRLFLERLCTDQIKSTPKQAFSKITRPEHAEAALDALCDDVVQCVVVDKVSLDLYKQVKAGPFKRLRVLKESEVFPPAAAVYYEGVLDAATLDRFKAGLLKANESTRAKEMMSSFKVTSFEPVPADYAEMLAATRKRYPAPAKITPFDSESAKTENGK
jgi:ABC-type phosphate/phosphonate transport system substrate-binding protein